jgi:di/tricarboxylate transporter
LNAGKDSTEADLLLFEPCKGRTANRSMEDYNAWITLAIIAFVLFALVKNIAPPDMLFVGASALLALLNIITPEEAFSGFANSSMLTVAVLFVVAAGLRETGVLDYIGHHVLGKAKNEHAALTRLAAIILPMSAFLNNTPIVAMFMPVVMEWCRRNRISPSKLLIPLSYLAILGGTCTLIGTSTNLVVNGLMIQNNIPGMTLFEISKMGIPYAIAGTVYLIIFGRKILPDRKELLEQLGDSLREYLVEMQITTGCRLIGQSIEAAGLRHLPGLFLIEINRDDSIISPVGPDDKLELGDRLVFAGVVSSIVELEKIPGFIPTADASYEISPREQRRRSLCEAVISANSPLIGKTIKDADFRATYGAAVVAVHRDANRVETKIGDIRLRPGDTLLLQTRPHFLRAYRNDPAFYLVSDVQEWRPLRRDRAWIAGILFVILLALMTTETIPIVVAGSLIAVLMVAFGCISSGDARNSIEWQVLVTIGASFGVGKAIENSGAAAVIAQGLVDATQAGGPIIALAVIYLLGSFVTELITNNAAAVLMFPFCLKTAQIYGVSERPFLIALILAASASFMTPIGYQTNMMVYGPGGYKFSDFIRIGFPLHIVLWVIAITLIPVFWPFLPK